jgi:hypothetical protein
MSFFAIILKIDMISLNNNKYPEKAIQSLDNIGDLISVKEWKKVLCLILLLLK